MCNILVLGLSSVVILVLVKNDTMWEYTMLNRENLETCIHLFSFGQHTEKEGQYATEVFTAYTFVTRQHTNANLVYV